ncbi:MAG: NAD(P)-dependent oxidoreductase [Desulfuromonadaceae bacterium]|nr:NAD(P)-dependent oxidoreductase [Desulfuromonadaceae bacterium]
MKLFLTGGSGFIGKNIIEVLGKRYDILAPISRELDLSDEIAVKDYFQKNKIDIVIHSAVRPGHRNAKDPSNQLYLNTRMFFNIIRNSNRYKRLISLGSGAVYDVQNPMVKVTEDYFDTHVPADEHGFSKYIIAKHMEKLDDAVKLRIFGVFGKYEDYTIRFITNAICKAICDLPITIRQNRRFDYLYIDDLMPVLEHFIHNSAHYSAYNVTPDNAVDLCSIARMVLNRSGKDLPIIIAEPGMGLEYSGDNTRLRTEIPELTFTPIVEAIDRLYGWYENNIHTIDKNELLFDK